MRLTALAFVLAASTLSAQIPTVVHKDNRYALLVRRRRPTSSSARNCTTPAPGPRRSPASGPDAAALHLNTIAAPIYWEQLEPREGTFDYTQMDELLKEARDHNTHLILLWFGTWKNGQMRYTPRWVKTDGARFPRVRDPHGEPVEVLSANADTTLQADKKAFVAMMHHLKEIDGDRHTVLMVQVENESGAHRQRARLLRDGRKTV